MIVKTDMSGTARLALVPGVYVAQLADLEQPDGGGGGPQIACGVGDRSATVGVVAHSVVYAEVACIEP
ncbi:MAG: hypothetical protein M3N95_12255 [Actinomycetota bacterium]|nr:hypothetical protein [Actinomycetota bacterium]